jgi:ketosteroid isomerase-like protein
MADHPNALRMRRAVERFMARDMEGFLANFADDVVWRTGGDNELTGVRRGKDELVTWFRTWDEKTGGSHVIEPVDVLADDRHLVVFLRIKAEREGASLNVKVANAFRLGPDGSFKESWWLADDQASVDRFFS